MSIQKVLLVGANGSLGTVVLDALVQANFAVSVLIRSNSASEPAHSASIAKIPISPEMQLDELVTALTGQDAVVAAFPLKDVNQHLRLVEAAYRAGVKRYIPADYGSCDAASAQAQKHLQLYRDKHLVQLKCEKLGESAAADGKGPFTWTSIVCGHFFDWGLHNNYFHLDLDTQTALILDAGDTKASASTLGRVAETVVRVLQRAEETKNRFVFVQSFCPTALEVVAALERATGSSWKKQHVDSNGVLAREQKKLEEGDAHAVHDIVFVLGNVNADWTLRKEFAMDLLDLKDESLDDVVKRVVEEHQQKKAA